jgi:hypothetical protein
MKNRQRREVPPLEMRQLWETEAEFSPEEAQELRDLKPAAELWPFPEPLPPEIEVEMPGEEEVAVIFQEYFGDAAPDGWSVEKARAMVNLGRKKLWRIWKGKQG